MHLEFARLDYPCLRAVPILLWEYSTPVCVVHSEYNCFGTLIFRGALREGSTGGGSQQVFLAAHWPPRNEHDPGRRALLTPGLDRISLE